MNDQMMLQQLMQMMRMGVSQNQPSPMDDPSQPPLGQNPLSGMAQDASMQVGMTGNGSGATWPSQLPTATPPPPGYQSPLAGLSPQLPPAHQGFLQRFLAALRGQNSPNGTGQAGQNSVIPQSQQSSPGGVISSAQRAMQGAGGVNGSFGGGQNQPNAQSSAGGINLAQLSPAQLQSLVKILLQRGTPQ